MPIDVPVALVTGGGRGIGRGICLALAADGFGLAVNYRADRDAAEDTAQACRAAGSPWVETLPGDVGHAAERERMVADLMGRAGRIDVLVNNAGISSPRRADMLEVSEETWDTVLRTNLTGPFFLCQLVARRMIDLLRAGIIRHPTIVNVSSVSAYAASLERAEYCVSKAGLAMVTQGWALRLAEEGIGVHEVRPGVIATDMTGAVAAEYDRRIADGLTPIRRWGSPADVGNAVRLLVGGQLSFSVGEILNVDGGFHSRRL